MNHLHQIKAQKFEQLTGPPITCYSSLESLSIIITIPENLPLSDAEKSVLRKGLNFVPISKKLDEFSVKQDVEKFVLDIAYEKCSCPTELISSYLDKIMAPIVRSLPSNVKDSQHALQIFRDFNFLG